MKKNMLIEINELCHLKILSKSDVSEAYLGWLNDYEVIKFTEQKHFKHSLKSVEDFIIQKYESNSDLLFGIFYSNEHIGNIKLGPIKWKHKSAEISYFIGNRKFWGKGIATKAVKKVVEYALDVLLLEKVNAGYYDQNLGSAKVLERCNFVVEGTKVSDVIFENKRINLILVGYISPQKTD